MPTALDDLTVTIDNLVFNARQDDDVAVTIDTEGLLGTGAPGTTLSPVQRARANGVLLGEAFSKEGRFALVGKVVAPDAARAWSTLDWINAVAPASEDVTVLLSPTPGVSRALQARREGEVNVAWESPRAFRFALGLVAGDPRWTATPLTGSTGLPATSGGLTFPHTFPHTFDATSVSGRVDLTNEGNTPGKVRLRLTGGAGGLVGPQVTHVTSGQSIIFATSLTLPENVWVEVDMDAHTIKEMGTASRAGWVTERGWSQFEPGANEWQFTAISGDGTLEVTAWPSWL